jgi:ribose transport system substrate-binding protein
MGTDSAGASPRSPLSRRSFLGGAAALSGLALASPLLAACGSSGGSGAAGSSTPAAGGGDPSTSAAGSASGSGSGSASKPGGSGSKVIGLSLNGLVEYDKYVGEGVAKALDGSGYELKVLQANFTDATELSNLESFVAQGVAGLVILPNTLNNVLTGLKKAQAANIPSSLCLWAIPTVVDDYVKGVAFVDSVKGGQLIGDWVKANAKPGKVVVVQGVVGQGFSENIDKGLDQSLAGSGFDVVVREQGYFDRTKGTAVVQRALQAHPDVTVIVDYAAAMGDGIASYLKQQNITNITHVTSDGDAEMMTWLGTPYLHATRYYSAAETGLIGGKIVLDVLNGKPVEFKNPVTQVMMTKENMADVLAKTPVSYPEYASKLNGV